MLTFIDPDPGVALLKIAVIVVAVVLSLLLWGELRHRSRRFGGGLLAASAMALAVVGLIVGLAPGVLPFEFSVTLLVAGVGAIVRPELVVKAFGGPSPAFRALREGRELALLVRERGGWSVARRDEEVVARVEGLAAFEGPGTERYIGLVRETVLADPAAPGVAARLQELAAADAELRAVIGVRPVFEREQERRAAELDGAAPEG